MNSKEIENSISQLVKNNVIGPNFIDILKVNFKIEEIYLYLQIKILKKPKKQLINQFTDYSMDMIDCIISKIDRYINEYSDVDYFDKLRSDEDLITNEFSKTIPIDGRK